MEEPATIEQGRRRVDARKRAPIALGAVAVISVVLVAYLLGPGELLGSSAQDTDGDGVPDYQDAAPTDSTIWGAASATVHIAIQFNTVDHGNYTIWFNGEFMTKRWVNFTYLDYFDLEHKWLYGPVNSTSLTINWICDLVHYSVPFHIDENLTLPDVRNDMRYAVDFTGYLSP